MIQRSFLDIFQLWKKLIQILQTVIFSSLTFEVIEMLGTNCYSLLLGALTFLAATLGELCAYFATCFLALIVALI